MVSVAVSPPSPASPSPAARKRFAVFTLGCKVNSFESEHLAQQLVQRGYRRVAGDGADASAAADLCVINTCTVTAEADRQARQLVRRAVRRHPAARVVVTGCYAQMEADACAAIPGVDAVIGNARKLDIPQLVGPLFDGDGAGDGVGAGEGAGAGEPPHRWPKIMVDNFDALDGDVGLPAELLTGFAGRSRAFVQVQQGCDRGCTFCIIHKARGPSRSLAPATVQAQVEKLAANGFREAVICGVDVGAYGDDFGDAGSRDTGETLAALLARLANIDGVGDGKLRLRLSSIDPAHITDSLIDLVATGRLCPQLHLSLQSADSLILKRMRRRANRDMIYARIDKLRRAAPQVTLSADILVGFPTETDAQFRRTLAAIDDLEIAWPHVFAYSPRAGTPAARIPTARQVPRPERKQRAKRARAAGRAVWRRVAGRRIGARIEVVVEGRGAPADKRATTPAASAVPVHSTGDTVTARAADYFSVAFQPRAPVQSGDVAEVEVTGVGDGKLIGKQCGARL